MLFLSQTDKARIARAIREAESRTDAEIVTVVARAADDYLFLPLLWSALAALLAGLPLVLLDLPLNALQIYEIQIVVFLSLGILTRWSPLKMRLVPRRIKRQRANHLARAQFLEHGLHQSTQGSGILIFVSAAERYVEIMADHGISGRVPPGSWDRILQDFISQIRARQPGDGLVSAVRQCGAHLAEHFPAQAAPGEARQDRLVEL